MTKDLEIDSKQLVDAIVSSMDNKKGFEITYIDFSNAPNTIARYFVICHGNTKVQVEAIADAVEEIVRKKLDDKPWHKEGFENAEWILLDYADVVVHIFQENARQFYNLEVISGKTG